MNILQPPAGLRLATAWRTAEGWNLDDSLPPVLALAVDPDDLEVRYITPGSCDTLSDSIATRSGRDTPREVEWADALALPSGEVIDAHGRTYGSTEQWLAALGARDVTRQLHPKHEQRKEKTDA
ncbi:MAG: hypothetical protein BroJett006_09460 [Betaproteobacteria bacterium]|nr:MAG: hypothetical protein BroJett006_09460 [Betaproteobacteria bacterium]